MGEKVKSNPAPSPTRVVSLLCCSQYFRVQTARMENYKQFLIFFILALAVGFVSIAFVLTWVLYYKEGLGWDGGAAEFNWHPLLMVIGFIFLQGIGKEVDIC